MILRTLFLRDLRDNWVFPRLVYVTTGQAARRNARRFYRFLVLRPRERFAQLLFAMRDETGLVAMLLATLAVLTELVRAVALLVLAVVALYVALSYI